jgi:hypothetical protein
VAVEAVAKGETPMTYQAGAPRYLPLDELLDSPRVRVLRLLRHFESATLTDLLVAGSEPIEGNSPVYQAFARALLKHSVTGCVERMGIPGRYRYRITPAGRLELRNTLAKAEITEQRIH